MVTRQNPPPKLQHLGLRVSRAQKSLVEAAAAAEGVTVSNYVRQVVLEAAQRRLVQEGPDDVG